MMITWVPSLSKSKAPKKAPNPSLSIKKRPSESLSNNSSTTSNTTNLFLNMSACPISERYPIVKPKDIDSASFLGKSNKIKRMDWGSCFILMDESIKVSGKITTNKAKVTKNSPIHPFMMAHIWKENRMATENTNGKMVKFIKANGWMD